MRIFFILTFFLLHFFLPASAGTMTVGTQEKYNITPHASFYNDPSGKMNLTAVLDQQWTEINSPSFTFPISTDAHWLTFTIKNSATVPKSYYLVYAENNVHFIDLFIEKTGTVLQQFETGAYRPTTMRAEPYHKYIFPVTLQPGEEKTVYIRMHSIYGAVIGDWSLVEKEILRKNDYVETILQGIFFGIIIVMFFYNIVLYLMTRYKPYIAYILYIGSYGTWVSLKTGYGILFFDFENVFIYTHLELMSSGLFSVFIIWFIKGILELKTKMPKMNLILTVNAYVYVLIWVSWVIFPALEMYAALPIVTNLFAINFLLMSILILLPAFILMLRGNQTALFIFFSWLFFLASMVMMILKLASVIPAYPWIDHLMQVAMALEAVLFSLILGNRYRLQHRMLSKQKRLSDMGLMIENIAHQWRQPLSGINADLLALKIHVKNDAPQLIDKQIDKIEEKTKMMSEIIHDFQLFYDPNKVKKNFSLNKLLEKAYKMNVEMFEHHNIQCEMKIERSIKLYGVSNEYLQVILAILSNASEALEQTDHAHKNITIALSKEEDFAVLSIQNNGPKVLNGNIEKIFNPYFTTKQGDGGRGIGMYMSKKIIVEGFNGMITLDNVKEGVKVTIKVSMML